MKTVIIGLLNVLDVLVAVAIGTGELGSTQSMSRPASQPSENSFRDLKIN